MSLIDRIRKEREFKHQIGNITFVIQIPKINYFVKNLQNDKLTGDEVIQENIINWEGITENDFFGDGSDTPVPFDREILTEYLADRPQIVTELFSKLIEKATERSSRLAELGNGQTSGSKKLKPAKQAASK